MNTERQPQHKRKAQEQRTSRTGETPSSAESPSTACAGWTRQQLGWALQISVGAPPRAFWVVFAWCTGGSGLPVCEGDREDSHGCSTAASEQLLRVRAYVVQATMLASVHVHGPKRA